MVYQQQSVVRYYNLRSSLLKIEELTSPAMWTLYDSINICTCV